jgi:hypothetical protein
MMFTQMPHPDPLWEPVYKGVAKQWKYDPMTGRSLKKPDDISPSESYCYERGYAHALEVMRQTSQREWQGLTDEEILGEYRQSYGDDGDLTDVYFARAIEAKLKEKNT